MGAVERLVRLLTYLWGRSLSEDAHLHHQVDTSRDLQADTAQYDWKEN